MKVIWEEAEFRENICERQCEGRNFCEDVRECAKQCLIEVE